MREACVDLHSTLPISRFAEDHLENFPSARVNHTLMVKLGSFGCISCGPDGISTWYGDGLALVDEVSKPIAFTCWG
jgi:hypothetical protein